MSEGIRKITDVAIYALGHLAEVYQYGKNWGDEFCNKRANECYEESLNHLKEFDFKSLSLDELLMVGFRMWTKDSLLCPLWAVSLLLKDLKDNDTRFGCVADGWKVKDGKVMWDERIGGL